MPHGLVDVFDEGWRILCRIVVDAFAVAVAVASWSSPRYLVTHSLAAMNKVRCAGMTPLCIALHNF